MSTDTQKLNEEFEKIKRSIKKPNILLAGCTGSGKSSLINHIFDKDIAAAGTGKPITQNIDKYEDDSSKVIIYDSKGYEIGTEKEKSFIDDVIGLCERDASAADKIHVAWYFISSSGSRVTDFDLQSIQRIHDTGTPIAIVFTKSDLVSEEDSHSLSSVIENRLPDLKHFATSTKTDIPEPAASELKQNLEDLITWTTERLPEALKLAFISEQRTNLEEKRQKARTMVYQHSTTAFATGFTPIPGSDAPILLANQYTLLARVMYLFGLDSDKDKYSALIKGAIAQILPTLGKWGAAQLVKAIPGIGTIIGGAINGVVAASLTSAFGFAIIETVYYARSKGIDSFSGEDEILESIEIFFMATLNSELKKENLK